MAILIILLHVIVCIALILIVLLQTGKGADLGAAFGTGSSQTLFGSSGAGNFMTKLTAGAAIVFMLTSLTLAYLSGHTGRASIMDRAPAAQTEQAPPLPSMPSPVVPGDAAGEDQQ
jgi:preprotein translocase subunit SecG